MRKNNVVKIKDSDGNIVIQSGDYNYSKVNSVVTITKKSGKSATNKCVIIGSGNQIFQT